MLVGRTIVDVASIAPTRITQRRWRRHRLLESGFSDTNNGAVMTKKRCFELSRAGRRCMLVASVLRSAATASLLVVLYYALPLNRPLGLGTLLVFGSGLLVFVGVAIWQV